MWYIVVIAMIIVGDQAVKCLVATNMGLGQTIPLIEGLLNIKYVQNTGAAFSLFENQMVLLIVIPLTLTVVGLVYLIRHGRNRGHFLLLSIAFIVGGGLGNIIDRVRLGYVVDMISVHKFPVFNVADMFVCIGVAMFCIYIVFLDGKKKRR